MQLILLTNPTKSHHIYKNIEQLLARTFFLSGGTKLSVREVKTFGIGGRGDKPWGGGVSGVPLDGLGLENTKKSVFSSYFGLCQFWKKLRTENWLFFCPLYYYITFISSNNQTSQCDTNIFEYSNISHRILDIRIRIFNLLITNIFDIRIRPIC